DNGTEKGFYTKASTLRQALKDANVRLDENDRTEPSLDEVLVASSYEVNVYRARPVTIRDGAIRTKIITAYRTGKQIAKQANIPLQDEDIVTLAPSKDIIADGSSEIMTIDRATPFTFTLYGTTVTAYTQAKTVRDMLKEKNITLGVNDRVSTALDTEITEGMALRVWREGKQTMTQDEDVDFETEKVQDADQPIGYKKVQTVGVKGKKSVTYEVVIEDGKEVRRTEINSLVTTQPVKQVEIVGAKFNYTGGPLTEAQVTALGTCESGMTATRNSGNGFYGAFQFIPSTWRNVAPAEYKGVLPHEAPLEAQKQAVQNLLSRSSIYTQFPGCAKKMAAQGIL
ncbi:MAG: ubiquitin-like domain-containing protein, partial [Candidatus Saccharimonas sp.]